MLPSKSLTDQIYVVDLYAKLVGAFTCAHFGMCSHPDHIYCSKYGAGMCCSPWAVLMRTLATSSLVEHMPRVIARSPRVDVIRARTAPVRDISRWVVHVAVVAGVHSWSYRTISEFVSNVMRSLVLSAMSAERPVAISIDATEPEPTISGLIYFRPESFFHRAMAWMGDVSAAGNTTKLGFAGAGWRVHLERLFASLAEKSRLEVRHGLALRGAALVPASTRRGGFCIPNFTITAGI